MGGKRIPVELFITCARDGCGQVKRVRNRALQKIQRFCSRQCATSSRVGTVFCREAQSRGGKMRAHRARLALIARVAHLTPVEAFRLGYVRGLESKHRQLRRRQHGRAA